MWWIFRQSVHCYLSPQRICLCFLPTGRIGEETMSELEQKKLEVIDSVFKRHLILNDNSSPDVILSDDLKKIADEILSALSQFDEPKNIIETTYATGEIIRYQPCEPLEVEIRYNESYKKYYVMTSCVFNVIKDFVTEQEAINFCKRHGLKIKE